MGFEDESEVVLFTMLSHRAKQFDGFFQAFFGFSVSVDGSPGVVGDHHPEIQVGSPIDGPAKVGERFIETIIGIDIHPAIEAVQIQTDSGSPLCESLSQSGSREFVIEGGAREFEGIESRGAHGSADRLDTRGFVKADGIDARHDVIQPISF